MQFKNPYQSYTYAYPHKMAYRPFTHPYNLKTIWATEDKSSLFLYFHLPFCNYRCHYCNLFSSSKRKPEDIDMYLEAVNRQSETVMSELESPQFARFAIGGGTPSLLSVAQLKTLFKIASQTLQVDLEKVPISFEAFPGSLDKEKLILLNDHHVNRISIGIQSFIKTEADILGRKQNIDQIFSVIETIKQQNFPILNLDLIYGIKGQTLNTWESSLNQTIQCYPEEIYLYPLYIRPMTDLKKQLTETRPEIMMTLYKSGRDFLVANGYKQQSMRCFKKISNSHQSTPEYCCQEDGMIGLGVGARSYTKELHYSSDYAISESQSQRIIHDYCQSKDFKSIPYGFMLNADEKKRRYLLKSLLNCDGCNIDDYTSFLGSNLLEDFPQLKQLINCGLAKQTESHIVLTEQGLALSDAIGPWFYSKTVKQLINDFKLT